MRSLLINAIDAYLQGLVVLSDIRLVVDEPTIHYLRARAEGAFGPELQSAGYRVKLSVTGMNELTTALEARV